MKWRLDAEHYLPEDKLVPAGTEIGDGTPFPFLDDRGKPRPPSRSMTPLDDEAKAAFKKTFEGEPLPERDPTKKIPIYGRVGA